MHSYSLYRACITEIIGGMLHLSLRIETYFSTGLPQRLPRAHGRADAGWFSSYHLPPPAHGWPRHADAGGAVAILRIRGPWHFVASTRHVLRSPSRDLEDARLSLLPPLRHHRVLSKTWESDGSLRWAADSPQPHATAMAKTTESHGRPGATAASPHAGSCCFLEPSACAAVPSGSCFEGRQSGDGPLSTGATASIVLSAFFIEVSKVEYQ